MIADLELVMAAERRLHDPVVRADAEALVGLLHPDFKEIGGSATTWRCVFHQATVVPDD